MEVGIFLIGFLVIAPVIEQLILWMVSKQDPRVRRFENASYREKVERVLKN